jgi:hypothetical protein
MLAERLTRLKIVVESLEADWLEKCEKFDTVIRELDDIRKRLRAIQFPETDLT